jgi:hypothetical protein
MVLHEPFIISSRLMPAVKVGDATISAEWDGETSDKRAQVRFFIDKPDGPDGPGWTYEANDLHSGVGGATMQGMFACLLSFLQACAESVNYRRRTGRRGENEDLFPPHVAEWASHNSDEMGVLEIELEETDDLLED